MCVERGTHVYCNKTINSQRSWKNETQNEDDFHRVYPLSVCIYLNAGVCVDRFVGVCTRTNISFNDTHSSAASERTMHKRQRRLCFDFAARGMRADVRQKSETKKLAKANLSFSEVIH